eukprot:Filipodium_phascolosomae@DN1295_c0_g1_i1.p1
MRFSIISSKMAILVAAMAAVVTLVPSPPPQIGCGGGGGDGGIVAVVVEGGKMGGMVVMVDARRATQHTQTTMMEDKDEPYRYKGGGLQAAAKGTIFEKIDQREGVYSDRWKDYDVYNEIKGTNEVVGHDNVVRTFSNTIKDAINRSYARKGDDPLAADKKYLDKNVAAKNKAAGTHNQKADKDWKEKENSPPLPPRVPSIEARPPPRQPSSESRLPSNEEPPPLPASQPPPLSLPKKPADKFKDLSDDQYWDLMFK